MAETWQVKSQDKVHGPFTFAQLQKLVASGRLQRETPIRYGENSLWIAAESVSGLFAGKSKPTTDNSERSSAAVEEATIRSSTTDRWDAVPLPESAPDSGPTVEPVDLQVSWELDRRPRSQTRFLSTEPSSWLDIFEWRFERYLTPWIIRVTWLLILFSTGAWVLLSLAEAGYAVAVNRTVWEDLAGTQALKLQRDAPPKVDRQVIEFKPEQLGQKRIRAIGWALGSILGSAFALLYLRVLCEFLIVLFNIASRLQRMEQSMDRERP